MTSSSSGYVTVGQTTLSSLQTYTKQITVPPRSTIVFSYKELSRHDKIVNLYCYLGKYNHFPNNSKVDWIPVWKTRNIEFDFGQVNNATSLLIEARFFHCEKHSCFQLFFSFLPEEKALQHLPSGFWNCSVDHYPSIQHHLACNVKTECEDGRDETEHCPFSSAECQGLVDLCNSCYKFVMGLHGFRSQLEDVNKKSDEYCGSLGGTLSQPKCPSTNWKSLFRNEKLLKLLTGFFTNDRSLPKMYRHALMREDKTAIHHSAHVYIIVRDQIKDRQCFLVHHHYTQIFEYNCITQGHLFHGAICEFRKNETFRYSKEVVTMSTDFEMDQQQIMCPSGEMSFSFFLCGSNQYKVCGQDHVGSCSLYFRLSHSNKLDFIQHRFSLIQTFTCSDESVTLSYTMVCDLTIDCKDKSDESFCKHPLCADKFTCVSGQCVPYFLVCDHLSHCDDESDENVCNYFQQFLKYFRNRAKRYRLDFQHRMFHPWRMHHNESCWKNHFECPGEINDCLPFFLRCNGIYDCLEHQDEEGCEDMKCPGLFRCRLSNTCLYSEQLCDNWPHCPMGDDEYLCGLMCPDGCLCQGNAFLCSKPFSAKHFLQLRFLDATGSGMIVSDMSSNAYLIQLILDNCSLTNVSSLALLNLKVLYLNENDLQHVNIDSFHGLDNLQMLSLSRNPLVSLHIDVSSGFKQTALRDIDLSYTTLTVFDTEMLSLFCCVKTINLSFTAISTINPSGFQFTPQLTALYLDGSPVIYFPDDIFKNLLHLQVVSTGNYRFCCNRILPSHFLGSCYSPKDEVSSCEDLLQSWTYRGFLWLITTLSLTGNVFCLCARFFAKSLTSSSGYSVFVINLTMADFLMGVYNAIIGVVDERFRGTYLYHDDAWKNSVACRIAGFLSLLSSEVSALIIWLITLDRFIVLCFPFSALRFERTSASVACVLTWLTGWFIAVLPLLPVTSHWEFYSQTGICIPLPVTRREFEGKLYSFGVMIVLNFILFLLICGGQAFIYWSVQSNALTTSTTKVSKDITIAMRLITVAVTDFMCWFPIGLCGILALAGVAILGEVNVGLAIFVLPLNSAINPFLYTFNTFREKQRKSQEDRLLKWAESHVDSITS